MAPLSPDAQRVADIFDEVAKGNGAPFRAACHDDIVWRTIGEGSWSGEFVGKQTVIDGGDVIVVQARGRNLTSDGRRDDNDYAFVIHFRGGRIARYEEYCDTDLITRVLPDRLAARWLSKPG